ACDPGPDRDAARQEFDRGLALASILLIVLPHALWEHRPDPGLQPGQLSFAARSWVVGRSLPGSQDPVEVDVEILEGFDVVIPVPGHDEQVALASLELVVPPPRKCILPEQAHAGEGHTHQWGLRRHEPPALSSFELKIEHVEGMAIVMPGCP